MNKDQISSLRSSLSETEESHISFISNSSDEQQKENMNQEITDIEEEIDLLQSHIEELRKSSNKMKSCIRINKSEIQTSKEENEQMKKVCQKQINSLRQIKTQIDQEKSKYLVYQKTINAFNQLRKGLGFGPETTPKEILKHSLALFNSSRTNNQVEQPKNDEEVSPASLQKDFDWLSQHYFNYFNSFSIELILFLILFLSNKLSGMKVVQ